MAKKIVDKEKLLQFYRMMVRIRLFEEGLENLFKEGILKGTAHPCTGQEAIATGVCSGLEPDDYILGNHRSHGHCIARGADLGAMMAEILGRVDGYCRGRGGSMHVADLKHNMLGANGIVGAGVPLAVGAAFSIKYLERKGLAVVFFGDGAANQGVVHESMNMAGIWKLPVVFVCENNLYALSVTTKQSLPIADVASRASAYGMQGKVVDGNDVLAVHAAFNELAKKARNGEGAGLLECKTYRWFGHSFRQNKPPRPQEEMDYWRNRCPIKHLESHLLKEDKTKKGILKKIWDEEKAKVDEAVVFAQASAEPDPKTLTQDVYSYPLYRGVAPPRKEAEEGRLISYAAAINEALRSEMRANDKIVLVGEDIARIGGTFGVTQGLLEEFGDRRVVDTPISEAAIAGLGNGAAMTGLKPIVEIQFIDLMTLAMDQLINLAAKHRFMMGGKISVPVVVRTQMGAGLGLGAQHSQSLESWFLHVPGLLVAIPSSPFDAKGLAISAMRENNPVLFLEHKMLYFQTGPVPKEEYSIPFGVAEIKKPGTDVTIIALAAMVGKALAAARTLEKEGISVEVLDPRTLVPLDTETILNSVKKTKRVLIVHEACKQGGPGGEIAAMIAEEAFWYLEAPVKRIGAPFCPVPYSHVLENAYLLKEEDVVRGVKDLLES
jgi:2-oxoisovalerate dehydrogenase E1 component